MILEKEYNVIENAADIEKKNYNSDASENHIKKLIGMRVTNLNTHATGTIESIKNGCVEVDFHGSLVKFAFPSSFAGILELEDESFQQKIQIEGIEDSFENFKRDFRFAINNEVDYLKENIELLMEKESLLKTENSYMHLIQIRIYIFRMEQQLSFGSQII